MLCFVWHVLCCVLHVTCYVLHVMLCCVLCCDPGRPRFLQHHGCFLRCFCTGAATTATRPSVSGPATHTENTRVIRMLTSQVLFKHMNNEYNTLEPLEATASHLDWAESVQSFTGFPHFTVRPWRRYFANWVRQGLVAGAGGGYWLTHQAINIKLSHIRIKSFYIQAHNLSNKTIA